MFRQELILVFLGAAANAFPQTSKQFDDAEIVESAQSSGGLFSGISNPLISGGLNSITSPDGPGPSFIGSLDNIFKSVQDFDQYRCIERMVCEFMQEDSAESSAIGNFVSSSDIFGGPSEAVASPTRFSRPSGFSQPVQNFAPQNFAQFPGPDPGFGPSFRPRPPGRRIASGNDKPGFFKSLSSLIFGKNYRTKRQTSNLQGNILRLLQATKLDNLKAFPYVRAALMGQSSRVSTKSGGGVRGGSHCAQMYSQCPSDPNRILNYLNNHNGGFVNQVSPTVDNEVGPIISAIVSDVVGGSTSTQSPTFAAADSLFTNAVANGAGGLLDTFAQTILKYVNNQ